MENQIKENPGKTLWRGAARDGGIIGGLLFATMLVGESMRHEMTGVIGIINFVILAGCIYVFTRRRSSVYGQSGFTFTQSMAYIILMMIFTGIITGIGDYLAYNVISPEYYREIMDNALDSNPILKVNPDPDLIAESMDIVKSLMRNPLYYIFYNILGKIIYGGIIGLFVSALVKRPPVQTQNNG